MTYFDMLRSIDEMVEAFKANRERGLDQWLEDELWLEEK